jgi:murein DD-endopeptidase MepM/ murein hydrolase activator NlpD
VLVGLQRARAAGLHVVLTLRSEFIGSCAHYHGLAETINDTQFLLPLMDKRALMRAVREPARLYGGSASQDFAEHVVSSAFAQNQLPILQHALMRLKQAALAASESGDERGWELTLELYNDMSGGKGGSQLLNEHANSIAAAIERAADPEGEGLPPIEILERALKALTNIDAQGRPIRRPLSVAQLCAETGARRNKLLDVLAPLCAEGVSFLRIHGAPPFDDMEIVDFSHEALIRTWGMLGEWILEEAADGRNYERLCHLAEEFERNPNLTLGSHEAAQRVDWWRNKRATTAWTERYGGNKVIVEELLASHRKARREKQKFYAAGALASAVLLVSAYMGYEWYEARALTTRYRALFESDTRAVDRAIDNSKALTDSFNAYSAKIAAPLRKLLAEPANKMVLSDDEYGGLKSFADGSASLFSDEKLALLSPKRPPGSSFEEARGTLQLPVRGKRVRSFGEKTTFGTLSKGIAIAAKAGAAVFSPADGLVVYAGEFRTYGPLLIISPGGGYHILLAGFGQMDVQVGQSILAGEPIGTMGTATPGTMGTTAPNPVLTVEFRKDQQPIDPDPWWATQENQPKVRAQIASTVAPPLAATAPFSTASVAVSVGAMTPSKMAEERIAVAGIVGAPGDAATSLSAALRKALAGAGFIVVEETTVGTYRVEGTITLGQAKNGIQAIAIEWVVSGPDGRKLGSVSQKNDVPEGSLDGAWGRTAEQAATAAAGGIVSLLPQRKQP